MPYTLEQLQKMAGEGEEQAAPVSEIPDSSSLFPDWAKNTATGATVAGLIPGLQPVGVVGGAALTGMSAVDAVRAFMRGDTSEGITETALAALGVIPGTRFLSRFAKTPAAKEALAKAGAKLASETGAVVGGAKAAGKGAKVAQTVANAATGGAAATAAKGGKRFAPVAGEQAELRRALREGRLAARALTRAGKDVPQELERQIIQNASAATELARKKLLEKVAANDPIIKGQRNLNKQVENAMKLARAGQPIKQLDASLTALLRRAGMGEDVIQSVRDGLAKQAPMVKGRKAKAASEAGFAAAELLLRLAPSAAGAAIGGAKAADMDIPERERWEKIFMGAALGAAAGAGAGALGAAGLRGGGKEVARTALNWHQFSMLASHKTVIQANLGSFGMAVSKAAELILQGKFKQAAAGLRALKDAHKTYAAAFAQPMKHLPGHWTAQLNKQGISLTSLPSRAIAAGDAVMSKAFVAMGGTKEEAMRRALSGTPQIPALRSVLNLVEDVKMPGGRTVRAKINLNKNPIATLAARYLIPFARPTIMSVENALKFSGAPAVSSTLRNAFGMTQADAMRAGLVGTGAVTLGMGIASQTSPELDRWTAATAGPAYLLARGGQHLYRGLERSQDPMTILQKVWGEFPLVAENISVNPLERFVPSGVRDVAKAIDPAFEREKGFSTVSQDYLRKGGDYGSVGHRLASAMGSVLARTPVLRESLPERPMPVDNFGQPKFPDRPAFLLDVTLRGDSIDLTLPKILTATPMINPPDYPSDDPLSQELLRIEQEGGQGRPLMQPPNVLEDQELQELEAFGGPDVDNIHRDVRLAGAAAKGADRRRALEAITQSASFQSLPDEQKAAIIRRLVQQIAQEGVGPAVGDLAAASMLVPERRREIVDALRRLGGR